VSFTIQRKEATSNHFSFTKPYSDLDISEDAKNKEGQVMLKVAVVILAVASVYAGIYSLMVFTVPETMAQINFKAITGKTLDSVQDADYLRAASNETRITGLYALTTVISCFFILFAGFRKAQKWAWWAFLVVGGIAWLWGVIDNIVIGNKLHIPLQAIGLVLFLVGILLPVKVFFAKEAKATSEA